MSEPEQHRQRPRTTTERLKSTVWWWLFASFCLLPILALFMTESKLSPVLRFSLYAGVPALSLTIITMLMASRVGQLVAALGIERLVLVHRVIGIVAFVLIVAHVTLVLIGDERHLGIFILTNQPKQVWAGLVAAVAVGLLIVLALIRRLKQPRYEGWHLAHVTLALLATISAGLHVLWLDQLWHRPVMKLIYGLLFATVVFVMGRRWLWVPLRMTREPYVVRSATALPGGIVKLELSARNHRGFSFKAGQFAWLNIGSTPFVFEDHPFSMSSSATHTNEKEFLIKGLGDFTQLLIGLRPGRVVYLDGPYGRFVLENLGRSAGLVFVAAGVGVTPILSMLRTLADLGYDKTVTVVIQTRTLEVAMGIDEVSQLRDRLNMKLVVLSQQPLTQETPDHWHLEVGVLRGIVIRRFLPDVGLEFHDYFICGSSRFVPVAVELLRHCGVPKDRLHTEQLDVA